MRRYADYLKAITALTEPYGMFPAGIYRVSEFSNLFEQEQVRQGIRLSEGIYLRRFPVWGDFRGNLGVQLSQALAAARAARLLGDAALRQLACNQVDLVLGRNPFGQSLMYGVGHNYAEVWVHPVSRWLALLAELEP